MTPCGTVGYTAPEIVKDERYSKSVDMWALGCVLYTLLCGFPPFYDESINVLTEKVARGYYTFLSPWWDDISLSGRSLVLLTLRSKMTSFVAKDLITHLLCVDPAQRYTIDEFLAHPWCNEQPIPAPTAPIPIHVRNDMQMPLDSPLLQSVRGYAGARSPGIATLKEAFDITYAVHRMEEEGARRKGRGFLQGLNEEDEDEDGPDIRIVEAAKKRDAAHQRAHGGRFDREGAKERIYQGGRAGPRDRGDEKKQFELNMGGATLLG